MKPTEALGKADIEKVIGQPISTYTISSGSNKGDNVAGNLLSIKVTTESGEKLDLVYKCFPGDDDPEQRQFVIQFGIFRTETCMYEKVFPRIKELLKDRKAKRKDGKLDLRLPIPKFISGFNDDQNDYVCLEDVRSQGFKMQDKYHSLTVPEVTLVMREIANLHALTYFLIRYDGDKLFEEDERIHRIKYNVFSVEDPMMATFFSKMLKSFVENTVELLEPRDKELAEHVRKFNEKNDHNRFRYLQWFNHNLTDKKVFACITHGDLWTNNILFKYAQENNRDTPIELKFIDFQVSRRGNLFEDLGYFFWTSTTPAFRKLHLINMLNEYYKSFEETLNQLQFPMPEGFTRGFLIDGFHEGILSAYCYMPFALSLQMGDLTIKFNQDGSSKPIDENLQGNNHDKQAKQQDKSTTDDAKEAPPQHQAPVLDFTTMVEEDKKKHKLRMQNSERALARLEELTREVVEMGLLQ